MTAGLIIATRNRAEQLRFALSSIERRRYNIPCVLVDDGSTDYTAQVLADHPWLLVHRIEREGGHRWNPGEVFNLGHSLVDAEVHIEQGGEVCHLTDCVTPLVKAVEPGAVAFATIYNGSVEQMLRLQFAVDAGEYRYAPDLELRAPLETSGDRVRLVQEEIVGQTVDLYVGNKRPLPFFFLGAIHRQDWEEMGGYDGTSQNVRNDEQLAVRLAARGFRFRFLGRAVGFHLRHGRT